MILWKITTRQCSITIGTISKTLRDDNEALRNEIGNLRTELKDLKLKLGKDRMECRHSFEPQQLIVRTEQDIIIPYRSYFSRDIIFANFADSEPSTQIKIREKVSGCG